MVRKVNHWIKSFVRGAGEESSRDDRLERAAVGTYQGSDLQQFSQALSSLQICLEESRQSLFQTVKSKIFRKEKNE